MQFTKAEEYGMLGVLFLSEKELGSITPLSEIAEAKEIPEKFLAKIFQSLSRASIVRSHRGVRGGFSLSKAPNEVTVKDVLESIHGPYHLVKCTNNPNVCDSSEFCSLRMLLTVAEDKLVKIFEDHTLADLVEWERKKKQTIS